MVVRSDTVDNEESEKEDRSYAHGKHGGELRECRREASSNEEVGGT